MDRAAEGKVDGDQALAFRNGPTDTGSQVGPVVEGESTSAEVLGGQRDFSHSFRWPEETGRVILRRQLFHLPGLLELLHAGLSPHAPKRTV